MSTEDTAARQDAMKFADGNVPMALEKPETESPLLAGNPQAGCACPGNGDEDGHDSSCGHGRPPVKPKRTRRTPEQVAADKAAKVAESERKKADRAAERERVKAERAAERVQARADGKLAKIREAEGGTVALPAVVLRDGTVRHVSDADAWAVMEMYMAGVCLDTETSGYPLGHQLYELRTVQLGGEHAAIVYDASDPAQMQVASLALTMAARIYAHSVTADAIPVVHTGLITWGDLWPKLYDSVLNAKLTDPKMSGSDADALKELADDLLREYAVSPMAEKAKNALFAAMDCLVDTSLTTPPEKNGWYRVNRYSVVMTRYAGSDVLDLGAVLRVLPPLPVSEDVLNREREFQEACAPVTYVGFKLDLSHIKTKIADSEKARAEAQHNVEVLSDGKITNPKSPDVIKLLPEVIPGLELPLHRKTKRPTADKSALEMVARSDDALTRHLCKQILEYRHCDTTLGLLLRPLEILCEYGDGRMRPTVYTIEASTGRCSCRRPNGQQFSRQGGVRACVTADPGYLGISADFQGCEIMVAAALSGDKGLAEAELSPFCYKCERDALPGDECSCGLLRDGSLAAHQGLHWRTAHGANGKDATKEHRYNAKRGSFTKLFGGGPDTAASQVGCAVSDMEKIFAAFNANAPVFAAWDLEMRQAYRAGSLAWRDYATGENRYEPIEGANRMVYRAYSGRNIYISNGQHAAGNGAIQGTARELLVDGVLAWKRTRWGGCPLLPIHDQIFGFVPAPEAREASAVLAGCMRTRVLSSPGFEVNIGVDVDEPFSSWPDSS